MHKNKYPYKSTIRIQCIKKVYISYCNKVYDAYTDFISRTLAKTKRMTRSFYNGDGFTYVAAKPNKYQSVCFGMRRTAVHRDNQKISAWHRITKVHSGGIYVTQNSI